MNLKNILWVRNTGKIVPNAPIGDNLFGLKLSGGSGVITTATGNPVSIVTNKAQNAISTILSYSPKQSGSGDPSPTNVRPIIGYNSLTLTVNGTDTIINLDGTYYGGVLDLTTGTLTVTHTAEVYDGTEEGWGEITPESRGYYLRITRGSDYTRDSLLISSHLKGVYSGSSASMPLNSIMLNANKTNLLCRVDTETDFQTLDSWQAFLTQNPMTVLFPLAEPITYTLTPQTVALLKGSNTLWTDGDSLSVTYLAKR